MFLLFLKASQYSPVLFELIKSTHKTFLKFSWVTIYNLGMTLKMRVSVFIVMFFLNCHKSSGNLFYLF